MRLFVAIDPPDPIRDALAALELRGRLSRPPRDQLHLTLRFLGEVDADHVPELIGALAVQVPRFTLRVAGGGAFPSASRPRVLWAGIGGDVDALVALATRVEAAVRSVGLPPADKPFRAHLTLARVRDGRVPDAVAAVQALPDLGEWPVREVLLVKSTLGERGAVHERLATFPLA
jgi:2'-5' RNA ligase